MGDELLLELLSEEIPARMQPRAIADLTALVRDKLSAADIPPDNVRGYVTPRRLTVIAKGIPARQPDRTEERRGPRVGAPTQAIEGFLRAAGLASIEQCEIRDTGRGEFYFAVVQRTGAPTGVVLLDLLPAAIAELPWPKSMRYPASTVRWVRPLSSALCLFDGEVIRFSLGGIWAEDKTRGHRFLSEGEITVDNAAEYLAKLEAASVVLDPDRRREMIAGELERLAAEEGLSVKPDPGLLDEVTGLVEFPVVLIGAIDAASMELPPEVLATAMRTHQKYFSCLRPDGGLAPRFLFVANNLAPDGGKTIVAGNERVLRARLADARFFWDQDRKTPLASRIEALKQRVYYDKLGTMYDKTDRIDQLAGFLAKQLVAPAQAGAQGQAIGTAATLDSRFRGNDGDELARLAQRAARLAKADLSTGMVGEFPELQGVMGRYYALHDGEDPRVAEAIADHYKPQGPNDSCPTAPVSVVVALADKLDSLAAFFVIGEKPSGSGDPFALRRAALGVIRLALENQLQRFNLRYAVQIAISNLIVAEQEFTIIDELIAFIRERYRVYLRSKGFRIDIINAVIWIPPFGQTVPRQDDLFDVKQRISSMQDFLISDDGTNLLIGYRRACNILAIAERDGTSYQTVEFQSSYEPAPEELTLRERLGKVREDTSAALNRHAFTEALSALAELRRPIDDFFQNVTVNDPDDLVRRIRLNLLAQVRHTMNQVADFSQIEG